METQAKEQYEVGLLGWTRTSEVKTFDSEEAALVYVQTVLSYDNTYGIWRRYDNGDMELICIVHDGDTFWN